MASTLTLQSVINLCRTHVELMPIADVGGFTNEPALSLANDTLQELLSQPFDWKFNSKSAGLLVTQAFRQDYLFAGATAFVLTKGGVGIDLKANSGITEVGTTVTVKTLQPHNFNVGDTVYMNGNELAAYNSTFTQSPTQSGWSGGWVITATPTPTSFQFTHTASGLATSGATGITDCSWLESCTLTNTQTTEPLPKPYPVQCVRKLRPSGNVGRPEKVALVSQTDTGVLTLRFVNAPNGPWTASIVYQMKARLNTKLAPSVSEVDGTFAPFPDEYAFVIRQMFLARCYRFLDHKRADGEYMKANAMVAKALGLDDAEDSEQYIVPQTSIMGDQYY